MLGVVGYFGLVDWRIRLHTLVKLDPPPAPLTLERNGVTLTITGALILDGGAADSAIQLRAWAPNPDIRVVQVTAPRPVTLRIENLPARVRLLASGPVDEQRTGATRTLVFSPDATRRIGFVAPADTVTFAVLGDTGDSAVFSEALHVARLRGADFLIHAGDVVYEDPQMPVLARVFADPEVPVYVVRGNHDYRNRQRIDFLRRLSPPYYQFRMGGASVVVLDNGGDYLPTFWRRSTQYRWWRNVLAEPRDGPFFVVMHKPPFDRRTGTKRAPMLDKPFARQLMADFKRAGVDAVLTGHVHETQWWVEDGIPYVVSGEGMSYPERSVGSQMAWVRVHGWETSIEQVPIWRR